jgi:RsiW-degrading membrane proteinase PrsW (M82 family)
VLRALGWLSAAIVPAVLLVIGVYRTDRRRDPPWLITLTFTFGALAAAASFFIRARLAKLADVDLHTVPIQGTTTLLFVLALVPVFEIAKVAATWPAFRSKHFDEPYDGLVYSSAAALGFAAVENALLLRANTSGWIGFARAGLALPAHVFFACIWGYALGRAKQSKTPGAIFQYALALACVGHGLYVYLVFWRGPAALAAVVPLLGAMGWVTWLFARDLRSRGERPSRIPLAAGDNRLTRVSIAYISGPPSLSAMREALTRADEPIKVRWIVFGALVTLGAMVAGLGVSVVCGNWLLKIDFSIVDEHDVGSVYPVFVLGAGLLAAFFVSGYLVARASSVATLLEPALAAAVAILVTLVALGFAQPIAMVFALACAPIAWGLACAGAWVGRAARGT